MIDTRHRGKKMSKTQLMGILNITPDSFYENSRTLSVDQAIARAYQIAAEGADILDIGAESSRPGAQPVSEQEELARILPVLEALQGNLSIPISIDTRKPKVAKEAIAKGVSLLNDITGFTQPEMIRIALDHSVDICVMHMQGTPQTMQHNPRYPEGILPHLVRWFEEKTLFLCREGIAKERIILDPGIGFGKTVADNLEIIHNLPVLKQLGFRLILGVSRKSFLSKILNQHTSELLPATLATNTLAVEARVDIIRVHDVKEHRAVIDFVDAYNNVG